MPAARKHSQRIVALFPYLADPEGFQEAVRDSWGQRHPDVELHFTDWNCYHSDPVEGIDVFVFESTYLTSFAEKGTRNWPV